MPGFPARLCQVDDMSSSDRVPGTGGAPVDVDDSLEEGRTIRAEALRHRRGPHHPFPAREIVAVVRHVAFEETGSLLVAKAAKATHKSGAEALKEAFILGQAKSFRLMPEWQGSRHLSLLPPRRAVLQERD